MDGTDAGVEENGCHFGRKEDGRLTADEMDEKRNENIAYEYLCHLEEAKVWIEACINEQLPATTELEEGIRNGVYLAKLGHFIDPQIVPLKKIYDKDHSRYETRGLHFKHTDNINYWLRSLQAVGLPEIFYPETTDIYDKKNMPRVMYCIHALSLYLFKLGKAPQIQDLYGKVHFTEEEISAMKKELEKYGLQMPAFSKIGGILATEMPVDEAELHAAIIAINEAIDHQVVEGTLTALQNPCAHLTGILPEYADDYQALLFDAKESKADVARNKSLDPDTGYIPDVYDELLTQAEVQGNINKVNCARTLEALEVAIEKDDKELAMKTLGSPHLAIREFKPENEEFYIGTLLDFRESKKNNNYGEEVMLNREEVQMCIAQGNLSADTEYQKDLVIKKVNTALNENDEEGLMVALMNPSGQLPTVYEFASKFYLEEFKSIQNDKGDSLDHTEIEGGIKVLSALALINQAVEAGDPMQTWKRLSAGDAHIANLDADLKDRYQRQLAEARAAKTESPCGMLVHFEIQECVDTVNGQVQAEHDRIEAVHQINEIIDQEQPMLTLEALNQPAAKLEHVDSNQGVRYQALLSARKAQKAQETEDPSADLWCEEIQDTINQANQNAIEGKNLSVGIAAVNIAVDTQDSENLLNCLLNKEVGIHSVIPDCAESYLQRLEKFKASKVNAGDAGSGWMMNKGRDGHKFYFNVHSMEYAFERPESIKKDHSLITKEEIQSCIAEVTAAHDREALFKANEDFIIRLQSCIRGYQTRKRHKARVDFMKTNLPAILKLQSWWRMIVQRQKYRDRMGYLKNSVNSVLKIQSLVRMLMKRKKYQERLNYMKKHEKQAIKIQAFLRSNWAQKDYQELMHGSNPPLSVVRKFVHLLDRSDQDYTEEIELEKLRQEVVTAIRTNQSLEADLNQMDIKIGLLVKNRITLQDVLSQHRTLKNYKDSSSNLQRGLKALSKQSRERLEAYQHLFYLLQTNPAYLAKLIFELPQSRTTKFMESVILTLYNYASNQREEFLLLKLFKTALEEEIRMKVDKMGDIVTGNPLVIKMIVTFTRKARGQGALRDLLGPLVQDVVNDRSLNINTNPVEVYKQWVNQQETQSGQTSGLPYDVTPDQALQHEEVRARITESSKALQQETDKFLMAILRDVNKIPYGMRYMAKILKDTLHNKFPQAAEKDVLKIVGNLIYYRYINSAIVAPDAFDIIDVSASKGLTADQRRNLGSIAKILQFAASNKGFGGDSAHLSSLNPYIMEAHSKFKKYFRAVCDVEDPDVVFDMDQYTDVTRITKPMIYISILEMIDTHKLLLEHQDTIAPNPSDPLHELLEDLGEVSDVDDLIGDAGLDAENADALRKAQLVKIEISLTLTNKFEVPEENQIDLKSLLIRTKRMLVDVIRCHQHPTSLKEVLDSETTAAEEEVHSTLIKKREQVDQRATSREAKLVRLQSLLVDTRMPLDDMKTKIKSNLVELEALGVVRAEDNYQALINSMVQDIRNQRIYRQRRKQEMVRLKGTLKGLDSKRKFFEEQIDYYNTYVKTCLDNLARKAKTKKNKRSSGTASKGYVKYTGARLHEKGVILEIEGLETHHFKNVLFEILSTEEPGVFEVSAKFMGVGMEKVELVFQDLLQKQYEGVAVMKMFDRAKVNVNLLIFLLNKKFYGS